MSILPPAVRAADTIAVCAPAGPVNQARLDDGIARLLTHAAVQVAPEIRTRTGYLAGSDARRADELNGLLRDPQVRAIVVARGGYGIMRILPLLDADALRRDPKPIVGFSDATALLSWADRAGVRGIHGPVASQLGDLPAGDLDHLIRVLRDPTPLGELDWPLVRAGAAAGGGQRDGRLIAANLTMLAHLIGTPWAVDVDDAVVVLEEVGEKPYAIDRYLTHLELAGALRSWRAAVVGDLSRCTDPPTAAGSPDDPEPALAVVDERLAHAEVPALAGAPVGHGNRNVALPWGARCTVDLERRRLIIHDGAVA